MVESAVILAAGVGARLGPGADKPPKSLLQFGGRSLLARHLDNLAERGIRRLTIVTGYRYEAIEAAVAAPPAGLAVETVFNPDFTLGSVISLWTAREALVAGGPVLLMDADVLYDAAMIDALVNTGHENCFLVDRDFVPGDEPVKLCIRDGRAVEFRKKVEVPYDWCGESVGFFRLSQAGAGAILAAAQAYLRDNSRLQPYEEPIRDVLLAGHPAFAWEDVTGVPWIEIDFPEDVVRAERDILPRVDVANRSQ